MRGRLSGSPVRSDWPTRASARAAGRTLPGVLATHVSDESRLVVRQALEPVDMRLRRAGKGAGDRRPAVAEVADRRTNCAAEVNGRPAAEFPARRQAVKRPPANSRRYRVLAARLGLFPPPLRSLPMVTRRFFEVCQSTNRPGQGGWAHFIFCPGPGRNRLRR